ncbi:maleylpyruvate isomerase family mycothiol-dependent enzyme [Sporichthya polymorpha]|uniref:maleylpyruvate isomerase family mycothiol-dependent enzyme n=1 Tax=Sporichthya polymorpha TaxID=35751 RepID=UPI00036958E2|nr:maleylpyruvate isomerase family mycothiol-dependent enzyme [Sporichthya polymorpha]
MTPEQFVPFFRAEAEAFARVLETGDLDAPVPACPDWNLTALTAHLGGIHRWARGAIVTGPGPIEEPDLPPDRDAIVAWFREGADALHETLAAADPQTPCWSFGRDKSVAFWLRRQALETAVHRWDAEASQGTPGPLDPALAVAGVHEVAEMFFPRQVSLGRIPPLARTLRLIPDEGAPVVFAGDGTASGPPAEIDADVAGPAEALLLLIWGRTVLDDPRLHLAGSRAAAEEVLAQALAP